MQSDELICLKLYVALKTSLTKTWYKPCPILQMRTYSRQYKSSQFYLKSPESKESQLAWRSFTICPQQRCLPALPSVSKWYYSWCSCCKDSLVVSVSSVYDNGDVKADRDGARPGHLVQFFVFDCDIIMLSFHCAINYTSSRNLVHCQFEKVKMTHIPPYVSGDF